MFLKRHLFVGLMAVFSTISAADEFEIDYDQQIIKLNQRINELEKKKNELEQRNSEKKWNVESYLGTEQEIDSDDNWKHLKGSVATSPYFGAFIYQDKSLWMYDVQILKTYLDNNSEYDRTRWQAGATRTFPFTFHDMPGSFKLRLGYRNDNWHYPSIKKPVLATPQYQGDIRKGEERHEIWVRPQFNYKYSDNVSFNGSLSFRFIDRKLDYARAKGEYGVYKRNWSSINEHFIGGTYTFNKKNSLWVNYLYIDENLINTLHNKEHFLWAVYRHRFDNGLMVMPYTRYALTKGKQSFRDSNNQEFLFKEKDRSRYGFQLLYPITNKTSLFWDTYYRPEVTWNKGNKENNHFWFWAIELRHTF